MGYLLIPSPSIARLQLFQKLSGGQRVSAREKYVNNGSEKKIQIEIKTHSRGLLPANKKIKESIISVNGKQEICVAVGLLSN